MGKVTGIGGIFFKTKDPDKSKKWYEINLGITSDKYGHSFNWRKDENPEIRCVTQWIPMPDNNNYFDPSKSEFMINYRVENLVEMMKELQKNNVQIVGEMEEYEYGKFAWIIDPDGRKIELWEPKDEALS